MDYQKITVDVVPSIYGMSNVLASCSQNDVGRGFTVCVTNNGKDFIIPERSKITLNERKPSGNVIILKTTYSGNEVSFVTNEQSTAESGICLMNMSIVDEDDIQIGTCSWKMNVAASPLGDEIISEPYIQVRYKEIERFRDAAEGASRDSEMWAQQAKNSEEKADHYMNESKKNADLCKYYHDNILANQVPIEMVQEVADPYIKKQIDDRLGDYIHKDAFSELQDQVNEIQEDLDTLQVGGTNLLVNTEVKESNRVKWFNSEIMSVENEDGRNCYKIVNTDSNGINGTTLVTKKINLIAGNTYTYSFWCKCSTEHNVDSSIMQFRCVNDDIPDSAHENVENLKFNVATIPANTWTLLICSFKVKTDSYFVPYLWNLGDCTLFAYGFKLEAGTVRTDWSPAPEDVSYDVINNLDAVDAGGVLDARQGKVLKDMAVKEFSITYKVDEWVSSVYENGYSFLQTQPCPVPEAKDLILEGTPFAADLASNKMLRKSLDTVSMGMWDLHDGLLTIYTEKNPATTVTLIFGYR